MFRCVRQCFVVGVVGSALLLSTGCSTNPETMALQLAGVTAAGGRTPGQELQQIYYLGVFDPLEQVPPQVYRVRVRGQASILSRMDFGSGWVPARVIDSLGGSASFDDGQISISKAEDSLLSEITTGRRLIQFGPEGFREAPKDHRLVIVMGSSPEQFFSAIDQSLTAVTEAVAEQRNAGLTKLLAAAQSAAIRERRKLDEVERDVDSDVPESKGGA